MTIQWEEKAREELADHCFKTKVDPATQLMRSDTPASLKEDIEVEHALEVFYAEMILWNLGVGREAQVLEYACLKFIKMLRSKCLSKSTTNIFGNRVSRQGPWGEGILFPLLIALQDGSTITALKLVSDVLYDHWPLGSLTVKRDEEEEELMMIICNQVLANTPMHKEPLGQSRYTAPRMFGYGAQMRKLEQHDNQFKQQMAPFHAAAMGKTQNRHPSDVTDRSHGSPLDKEEASSCHVVLVKEQQPDSITNPDI